MAPDPANFVHQLPQKESGGKLWLQIPPTLFISSLKKNPAENYMAPDPANFLHHLPQKESGRKSYGSRSRQQSADIIRANEIAIQNSKTGKVKTVIAI